MLALRLAALWRGVQAHRILVARVYLADSLEIDLPRDYFYSFVCGTLSTAIMLTDVYVYRRK